MSMDCKAVEKLISKFIREECTPKEEEQVLEHIRTCTECKEELTIQLLLDEGLNRLESGESFDLNRELDRLLKEGAFKKKKSKKSINPEVMDIIADIVTGAIIIGIIVGLLIWKIQ